MMCPGLWTWTWIAIRLSILVLLLSVSCVPHSLYPQLSSFCLGLHPFPLHHAPYAPAYTRARTLLAHYTYIYHEHDIHPPRTTPIEFYTSSSLLLTVFHSILFLMSISSPLFSLLQLYQYQSRHSCFMSITVLLCHSSVCLCLSCLSLCHAHLTSTATHKPSHTAAI